MAKSVSGTTLLVNTETSTGLILDATITGGTIPTTASLFAPGASVTDLSTGVRYINLGTTAVPSWEAQRLSKTVALTAAQLIAMYATPVEIVPAVPGKAIIVDSVDFVIVRTATQFTSGGVVAVQYNSTANGAGTSTQATTFAAAVVTAAAGTTYSNRQPAVLSDIATASITNIGLFISNATAAFATGTGTATVTVSYHLV